MISELRALIDAIGASVAADTSTELFGLVEAYGQRQYSHGWHEGQVAITRPDTGLEAPRA